MSVTGRVNGYTVSPDRASIGVKTYKVKEGVLLPVRASVAPLLIAAAKDFDYYVEPLHPGWCWGYNYRPVTNGTSFSFHAAAIAIDLNAPLHPYGKSHTFTPMQEYMVRAIARKYGLRWGGDYTRHKDDMHLEVIISPAQAQRRIAELRRKNSLLVPFPGDLRLGSHGMPVKVLQRALNRRPLPEDLRVDGDFGRATEAMVNVFKKRQGLPVNGIVGYGAWDRLF